MKRIILTLTLALFTLPILNAQDIKLNGTTSAENNQIKNVADPTDAQDATTKNYVDTNISALASNPLGEYFPDGISLGDLISWVWDGTIWEPTFSQLNSNVISLVSDPGTDTQIVCEFESIQAIQYAVNGDTTGMSVTGLPSGIGHSLANGILTISGNANQDVSTQTTFNFTVTVPTQDANVNTIASGTLVIAPKSSLVLDSGVLNQTSCLGEPIEPITFIIEGKSPNATVTGLPDGVSANIAENKVIISGTPPASLASGSRFDFTVQTNSSACAPDTQTGSITVTDCSTCYPTASAGADFSVCAGNPYAVQNASAANYTTLQWTTSGTGTFNSTTTTSPTYVPSNADIANGQVTLTLTTTNSSCTQTQTVVDEMVLTLTQCNSIDVTLQNNNELELFGNTMTYGAQVVTANMHNISQVGVCYSTAVGPTVDDATITENNSGTDWWAGANPSYELTATGLSPNTTYYVRAFAKTINDNVVYGDQVEVSYTDPNIAEVYNFNSEEYSSNGSSFSKITRLHLKNKRFRNLNLTQNTVNSNNIKSVHIHIHPNNPFGNIHEWGQIELNVSNQMGLNSIYVYGGNNQRVHFNIGGNSSLKTIYSPDLKFLNCNINNNENLESWTTTNVQEAGSINIHGSTSLTTLDFPELTKLNDFNIYDWNNNNTITTLLFPKVVSGNSIYIERGEVTNMDFSSLETLNSIYFYGTPLNILSLPNLKHINQLGIYNNQSLTEIDLPKLENVGNGNLNSNSNFKLDNNNVLTNLDLASLSKIFGFLEIRNNNLLDVSAINNCDFFVYNTNGYKCEFGEVNINGNANNNYCFQDSAKIQQPTLLTTAAIDVTQTTATSGGSVVSPQGTIMKRKGVCWSTSPNPTVDDNVSDNGYGNDDFNSYIFGLLPNTTYHYRAYAEDCNGIYYGNEMSFETPQ
jgi:hypothetical protein